MPRPVYVVLTAAGMGTRLGFGIPKALVPIGAYTIVERALVGVQGIENLRGVVVTAAAEHVEQFSALVAPYLPGIPVKVVAGGSTRQTSVHAGLECLVQMDPVANSDDAIILIHDAARCLTPQSVMTRVIEAVYAGYQAVVPAIPVADTIRVATGIDGTVSGSPVESAGETLQRSALRAVQTPQGFPGALIVRTHRELAYDSAREETSALDDASMVSMQGYRSVMVMGDRRSHKITVPDDLLWAQRIDEETGITGSH